MTNSYLYTETAFHHEGDFNYLKNLVLESKKAGAKGVKFQVLTNIDDFVSSFHKAYKNLAEYCLSFKEWDQIFSYAHSLDLDIIMMPLNIQALDLLKSHKVKYLDIHSVSFNDTKLLEAIKATENDIILGIGGRTLDEIFIQKSNFGSKLKVLILGFQSFPSKIEKIKLGKISQLKTLFPDLTIGYADHSSFKDEFSILSNEYARLLGATIFEKHITLNEGEERVDAASAVGSKKIKDIIDRLTFIDKYIINTDDSFIMTREEITYRNRQLVCVANKDLKIGEPLNENNVTLKMFDEPDNCYMVPEEIYNKTLKEELKKDEPILFKHF